MREITVVPISVDNRIFGNTKRTLRVASYSRVSTNFEEQISSFELQKAYYTDLILRTKGWTLAGTYADEGISGVTEKRPEFLRLLKHCRQGKIDLVITKSMSRFARNTLITMDRIRELKSLGVGIYFEKENLNTLEESSEFVLTILASIAQEESHSLSLNVRKGKQMAMQRGTVHWNYSRSFGYEKGEDGEPAIIEEQAEIIRRIYREYISGESDAKIATMLNESKVATSNGKDHWKASYVQRILQNERYCGDVILQKTYIENHITKKVKVNNGELPKVFIKNNHVPIISREVFEQARKERQRRNSRRKVSKNSITEQGKYSSKYALSDKLVCGDCGSSYRRVVWTKRNKEKQAVWRCIKRIDYGTRYCENSVSIDEDSLHNAIMNAINQTKPKTTQVIDFISREVKTTLSHNIKTDFDINGAEVKIELITKEVSDIVAQGLTTEKLDFIKQLNIEAMKVKEKMEQYKKEVENEKQTEKIKEIEEFLTIGMNEVEHYDDKLVRQIIHTVKVIDETKVIVIFNDGLECEQNIELKVKTRNK